MSNTENEAESIREEINEYELKSSISNKIRDTQRKMNEDYDPNEKMLDFFSAKLKEYEYKPRPIYEIEMHKKHGINHQELDKINLDTLICISETIKQGEFLRSIISSSMMKLLILRRDEYDPIMKRWSELIDQLKSNRITLKQYKEEISKEKNFINNVEDQITSIYSDEYTKKSEVDELEQKCTLMMKKSKDESIKYAIALSKSFRASFEKQNKSDNNFKEKYIKYKGKYLLLKNKLNE
jgi:hypothetical protein